MNGREEEEEEKGNNEGKNGSRVKEGRREGKERSEEGKIGEGLLVNGNVC